MNFSFDTFLEELQIIEETGAPFRMFKDYCDELNCAFPKLTKYLDNKGIGAPKNAGNTRRKGIVSRYLLSVISDMTDKYLNEDGEPMTSQEITKNLTGGTKNSDYIKALKQVINENPQFKKNQEFLDHIQNTDNLDGFLQTIRAVGGVGGSKKEPTPEYDPTDAESIVKNYDDTDDSEPETPSNRRLGAMRIFRSNAEMSMYSYERLAGELIPKIKKIRALMRKGDVSGDENAPEQVESNTDGKFFQIFSGIFEDTFAQTSDLDDDVYEELESLSDKFSELLDSDKQPSRKELSDYIKSLQGQINEESFRVLVKAFGDAKNTPEIEDTVEKKSYPGIDAMELDYGAVNKVLGNNPKEWDKLDKWLVAHEKWNKYKSEKKDYSKFKKKYEKSRFHDKEAETMDQIQRLNDRLNQGNLTNAQIKNINDKIARLKEELDQKDSEDISEPSEESKTEELNNKMLQAYAMGDMEEVRKIQKQIEDIESGNAEVEPEEPEVEEPEPMEDEPEDVEPVDEEPEPEPQVDINSLKQQANDALMRGDTKEFKRIQRQILQSEDEEGVMGYMTEQINKDSKFKQKQGSFVDRGWKKPVNYHHWLSENGKIYLD